MRTMLSSLRALAALVAGALAVSTAPSSAQTWPPSAQTWPQRTVRVVVPLPPGTSTDLVARLLSEKLSERWRQPVFVENRQGADGIPAVAAFASARDDHTLLFSFAGIVTINPLIYDKLPYDAARDTVPIVSVSDNFIGIGVSQSLNIKSINDLIGLARSRPGKLNWAASPGNPLYAFAALQKSAGIEMVQVSYRDFRPALLDVGEGRIQAIATGVALMLPQVQAGKIKLVMLNNRVRSPEVPDVPTAKEAGFPELTLDGVVGFYGWRDMPVELKERIAADVHAVADPAIAARVATMGTILAIRPPSEFAAVLEQQRATIAEIAKTMKPTQ